MRKLFARSNRFTKNVAILHSYLLGLKQKPLSVAGIVALFVMPAAAFGWWYYSVVTTLARMSPQQQYAETSSEIMIFPSLNTATPQPATDSPVTAPVETMIAPSDDNSINTEVKINGDPVPLPDNGSIHKVITNEDGRTKVDISIHSDTSGSTETNSSTSIQLESSTDADIDIHKEETK